VEFDRDVALSSCSWNDRLAISLANGDWDVSTGEVALLGVFCGFSSCEGDAASSSTSSVCEVSSSSSRVTTVIPSLVDECGVLAGGNTVGEHWTGGCGRKELKIFDELAFISFAFSNADANNDGEVKYANWANAIGSIAAASWLGGISINPPLVDEGTKAAFVGVSVDVVGKYWLEEVATMGTNEYVPLAPWCAARTIWANGELPPPGSSEECCCVGHIGAVVVIPYKR
jgi:hypothetical protein